MPFTYNGVGTTYYGKKNLEVRAGTCRSCNRHVQLQSYDTRLWFVILLIPVIPLGRKRIMDYCPSCRRHYVMELDKWETTRQLEVSGAKDKFRSDPTPENAIAVHQQMIGFHQINEATEFQKTMVERFPDNAKIHAYLGNALDHIGRRDQAQASYQRALDLRPDLPEARVGLGRGYIREGRLDDARKMFGFLEKSGSGQLYSLEPLETLAHAYQSRGQHREALELFEVLQRELPKVAEHPIFRKAVKKSEKAVGSERTMLPKQGFSLKRIFQTGGRGGGPVTTARTLLVLGTVAALVLLCFGFSNEYIRHHRKIYLINDYATPATVEIPGVGAVRQFKGVTEMRVPEGHHHAVISGPVNEDVDFEVQDTYFNRWFGEPLWLINVGGGALLELTVATYSQNPGPASVSFYAGDTFEYFASVDHAFEPLPKSIEIQGGGERTLIGLERFNGDANDVLAYLNARQGVNPALDFGEKWLRAHPEDEQVLAAYAAVAEREKKTARLDALLRSNLTNQPIRIAWHRTYQNLHNRGADRVDLLSRYDELLRNNPTNPAALYLRGRLETNRAAARDYFMRSSDGDPRSPFPVYALGYDRVAAGDWSGARPYFARAVELNAHDVGFAHLLFITRLALNEAPALEQELRKKLAREPLDYVVEIEFIDTLAAENKGDEAVKSAENFAAQCVSRYGPEGRKAADAARYHAYYAVRDFDKLKSTALNDRSDNGRIALAMALIEQGALDDAAKALPSGMDSDDEELFSLALAAVYRQSGNEAAAAQWRSRAVETLRRGSLDDSQAADLISRGAPPSHAEAAEVAISPHVKAAMLTMLAQEYPQARAELLAFARQLNVGDGFPYYLVQTVTAKSAQ